MRIGSLFSGYEGLGMAVQSVMGGELAWVSDIDPGACKILAHRYPDVPNLGDITTVDWSQVEPVDVLTGGFPCQDVSAAGKRAGIRPDSRSGLWTQMAYAIDQLRPSLVVIENVRGLLSADAHHPAHGDMEPCPWCMGDDEQRPLRALGAVLGELADIGYDASWQGLRAADIGAPHGRFRVFIVAWPATDSADHDRDRGATAGAASRRPGGAAADTDGIRGDRCRLHRPGERRWKESADRGVTTAHTPRDGRHERRPEPAWLVGGPDAALSGDAATDAHGHAVRQQPVVVAGRGGPSVAGHPGPDAATDAQGCVDRPDFSTGCPGTVEPVRPIARASGGDCAGDPPVGVRDVAGTPTELAWGPYAAAIARWERVLGRPAPPPTELSAKGTQRLSPRFVEFLMGLPAGWVTDVPELTRNEQLKALGNGVVPAQAAEALRMLLPDMEAAA